MYVIGSSPLGAPPRPTRAAARPASPDQVEFSGEDRSRPVSRQDLERLFAPDIKPEDQVPSFHSEVVAWSEFIPTGVESPASIGPEGNLYFQAPGGLVALAPEGHQLWSNPTRLSRYASPVATEDTVFAVSDYRPGQPGLIGFSTKTGQLEWEGNLENFQEAPILGPDGSLYAGDYQGNVVAFNPDRSERWRTSLDNHVNGQMALGPEGNLYVIEDPGIVHAFGSEGKKLWTEESEYGNRAQTGTGVTVAPDGGVLYTTMNSHLRKVSPEGKVLWQFGASSEKRLDELSPEDQETALLAGNMELSSTPVLSPDGQTIYAGGSHGKLLAVDQQGHKRWSVETGLDIGDDGVQVGDDGTIYATCDRTGQLKAFSSEGQPLWRFSSRTGGKAVVTTKGDMVYLATDKGQVHALSSQSLAKLAGRLREQPEMVLPTLELGDSLLTVGDFHIPIED
ncbi:MAG: PQQ-binding-like beta-propeller repeat protein [Vulcanimicrobiota bacterium]